jgi:hypothetical protein
MESKLSLVAGYENVFEQKESSADNCTPRFDNKSYRGSVIGRTRARGPRITKVTATASLLYTTKTLTCRSILLLLSSFLMFRALESTISFAHGFQDVVKRQPRCTSYLRQAKDGGLALRASKAPFEVYGRGRFRPTNGICNKAEKGKQAKSCRTDTPRSSTQLLAHPMGATAAMASITGAGGRHILPSYWLVRIATLHSLGFIYIVAFLVALHQNRALIGSEGITPAHRVLDRADARALVKQERRKAWEEERLSYKKAPSEYETNPIKKSKLYQTIVSSSRFKKCLRDPFYRYFWDRTDAAGRPMISLLWLVKDENREQNLDQSLDLVAYVGLVLACITFVYGSANVVMLLGLWLCQRTLMSVGGPWYGFGWETVSVPSKTHWILVLRAISFSH